MSGYIYSKIGEWNDFDYEVATHEINFGKPDSFDSSDSEPLATRWARITSYFVKG